VPFYVRQDPARSLSALQDGSSRLEALRILRMRQVVKYVAQQLSTPLPADEVGPDPVWEDHIEILCNGRVLPAEMDLYSARLLAWRNPSDDMELVYRRRLTGHELGSRDM